MLNINGSTNYIWANQNAIVAGTIATPYIVEGGVFFYKFFQNFEGVKKKINEAVQFWIFSFKPVSGESSDDFVKRLLKNVAFSLLFIGSVGTALGSSFYVLPSFLFISIAVSTIALVGDLFINAPHYSAKINQWGSGAKSLLIDSFTIRHEESEVSAKLRIFRNTVLAIGGTLVALAALGAAIYFTSSFISAMRVGLQVDLWHPLEVSGALLIFSLYGGVGLVHGALGLKKWNEGEKKAALFHFISMMMGFVFPTLLLFTEHSRISHACPSFAAGTPFGSYSLLACSIVRIFNHDG